VNILGREIINNDRLVAHLKHGIKRIVIFDIDLHHGWSPNLVFLICLLSLILGNGTQSIVWQINEEFYRRTLQSENEESVTAEGPQIFYGSIHDILSYPCEVRFLIINPGTIENLNQGRESKSNTSCFLIDPSSSWTTYRKRPPPDVYIRATF
jgi:acetoin utilization deacetylase AcuC-like enzyme